MAAGQGFKTFTTGEVLTAADVNGYLMQGVGVFADSTERDAEITSPQEGQFAYLKDTNVTTYYTGSAWANLDTTGMTNPMTTTGDTIYSSSGSTPARLGIGSTGQVLTVAGGVPTWATASSGGMTLLSTTSMTSGQVFTVSSIDQSYTNLYIEWYGMTWTSLDRNIYVYCNGVTNTMNYSGTKSASADAGINGYLQISGSDQISYNTADNSYSMTIEDYTNTSRYKTFRSTGTGYSNSITNFVSTNHGGTVRTTSAITSISITPQDNPSYTFTAGTCKVWGIK